MSKQQTAVEWLLSFIEPSLTSEQKHFFSLVIEQAKEMQKEQIKSAYNKGYQDGEIDSLDAKHGDVQSFDDAENYYNDTYTI
jgi:hypothetical protein